MSSFFGYGVKGKQEDPYYSISHRISDFDSTAYGNYFGFYYSLTYVPVMLVMGHITDHFNRTVLVSLACIMWGVLSYAHSYADNVMTLYLLRLGIGFAQAVSGPPTYSLITDFFA